MKLSIIIVSWNVKDQLIDCVQSIKQNPPTAKFEIIVIDNASIDSTVDSIKRIFPDVTLIENKNNLGFAAANNQGIEKSQGQYLLILNPDTIVHTDSLNILVKFMDDNQEVGACGPMLVNKDGSIQRSLRRFPTFRAALYQHTIFRRIGLFRRQYHRWLMKDFAYDCKAEVDQLMGAAMMVRRSVIEQVGTMDEQFFMYYEEVDLCHRIKSQGWRIVFVPEAVISHIGCCSSGQIRVQARIMLLTSLLHYFRKHNDKIPTAIFNCFFKPAVILGDLYNLLSGIIIYILTTIYPSKARREKSLTKVNNSVNMLTKYSWRLLFKT